MKKLLTAIAMAGFLVCPGVITAAYIIHLKDGRDFVTGQYSEEGDLIRFERYGGLIGIRKDLVKEIEEIKDLPDENEKVGLIEAPHVNQSEKKQGAEAEGKIKSGKKEAPEAVAKESGAERIKEQEKPGDASEEKKKNLIDKYTKEFNSINEKFKNVQMMSNEDLYKFVNELITFKKGVLSNRVGGIFSKHLLEIYSMLDEVEATLKWRSR